MRKLRTAPRVVLALTGVAPVVSALPLAFDVASVKTAVDPGTVPIFCIVPCAPGERLSVVGNRVDIRFMSLHTLMVTAYRIKPHQLSGPDWMRSQRFDIAAKIPDGFSKDRVPEMPQALLAERFKLSFHRDSKEQPVMALVVGKNGFKLQPAAPDAAVPVPEASGGRALYSPQGDARMLDNGNLVVTGGAFGPIRGGAESTRGDDHSRPSGQRPRPKTGFGSGNAGGLCRR